MRFKLQMEYIEKIIAQRNGYMVLGLSSLFICALQVIVIFILIGKEKIILVPPTIEKSFWVSAQHVSPEYLEEMALFFANMRLNITPVSAAMQRESLLRYSDPDYYGAFKSQLIQEADRINDQHITLAFYPDKRPKVDVKHFQVIVTGDLKSYVGDTALPNKKVSYLLTFRYNTGRLLVKSFEEVKHA